MRFEWDDAKNRRNILKHGVSFEAARLVFDDPLLLAGKDRVVDGEERWLTMGQTAGDVLLVVAHTLTWIDEEEVVRIISARKAIARERRLYAKSSQALG
jgi:uncharacterized protein